MSSGISIFLPNGDPNGVKVVGINGWNGKALIIPRANLKEVGDRPEVNAPAIYFLFGEGEDPSRHHVYIGESENGFKRLLNHADNKDFWNIALVFTGIDLDRADVKFLENQSIRLAKEIDRYEIENQVEPLENRLTEIKRAANDEYFEKIQFIMALFGLSLFEKIPEQHDAIELYYFKTRSGAEGRGTLLPSGEFIVYAGSTAVVHEAPHFIGSGLALRNRLVAAGVLVHKGDDEYVFTKDYIFTTPTAAAGAIRGSSLNGWDAWKDAQGRTLDENKRK